MFIQNFTNLEIELNYNLLLKENSNSKVVCTSWVYIITIILLYYYNKQ